MKVIRSRLVYIDSEINSVGNGRVSQVNFPSAIFSVAQGQTMRIILNSFEMRRNFYSVNPTNNTFYLFNPAGATFTEIQIAPGNYQTFTELNTAIQLAVSAVIAGSTSTYTSITRKFSITLGGGAPAGSFLVCFQVKQGTEPTGVSPSGFFNDSCELLGAIPSRTAVPVNAFRTSTGVGPHISPFPGSLNTLEAVYIRTNLVSSNYQTFSFEKELPDRAGLTPSTILARVPLTRSHFDDTFSFVNFEDPNDLFSVELPQTQLSNMTFVLSDDKGRLLSEVSPDQAFYGNLSFKLVLKWEAVEQEVPQGAYRVQLPNSARMVAP